METKPIEGEHHLLLGLHKLSIGDDFMYLIMSNEDIQVGDICLCIDEEGEEPEVIGIGKCEKIFDKSLHYGWFINTDPTQLINYSYSGFKIIGSYPSLRVKGKVEKMEELSNISFSEEMFLQENNSMKSNEFYEYVVKHFLEFLRVTYHPFHSFIFQCPNLFKYNGGESRTDI